jgi:hypothetical protein
MECRSIADTIVEFAAPLLRELAEPPNLDALKQALELAISVWNAHVMASPAWGRPEQLDELSRLVSISASPAMVNAVSTLSALRQEQFAADVRVVRDWEVMLDEGGLARFDCTAQAPADS